jgi:GTP pyrophosphokinase
LYGDKVAGILTSSKGLVLHRFDCGNLLRAKQKDEQWLEVDWQADSSLFMQRSQFNFFYY